MAIEEEDLNLWQKANNWFDQNIFDFDSLPKGFPFNMSDADNLFRGGESQGETASRFARPQEYPIMNMIEGANTALQNLDSPFKGVCVLPNGMVTQQMSRIECDAAGGTYSDPSTVKAEAVKRGAENESLFNLDTGIPGALALGANQLGQVREATEAGAFDNRMQALGLEMTPEVMDFYTQYGMLPGEGGKNNLISEQGDTTGTAVPYGLQTDGLLNSEQMKNRYPDRYAENAIANKNIFDDQLNYMGAKGDVAGRGNTNADNIFLGNLYREKQRLQRIEDSMFDSRMGIDASAAPAYGAEQAIIAEEARLEEERQQRLANMQSNIAQQDEMESGFVK